MTNYKCEPHYNLRLCMVDGKLGYFHTWEQYSEVIDPSPLKGGHPGGTIAQVFGIVEFSNGIRRVNPCDIKFITEKEENDDILHQQ